MTRKKLLNLTLALAVLGVAGCQSKVATILEKDNAQLALALNKDGSVTVVGVGAGERVKPCELPPVSPSATQDAGRAVAMPDEKALAQCFPDGHVPGKILFQQTYTMTVREGSLCIDVWVGNKVYVYCNPPYPISYSGH